MDESRKPFMNSIMVSTPPTPELLAKEIGDVVGGGRGGSGALAQPGLEHRKHGQGAQHVPRATARPLFSLPPSSPPPLHGSLSYHLKVLSAASIAPSPPTFLHAVHLSDQEVLVQEEG
jgi:hypothetical protein